MTATRDRRSDLDDDHAEPAWDERPIFGSSRGLPWWGAVLLAFGLALLAAVIDMQTQETLGKIYQGAYVLGCVGAVCLVRRANLFGPMVQPPLVFAVTAVGSVLALGADTPGKGGKLLSVALPLTSNFPTMGITTAVVVVIGVARLFLQRDPSAGDEDDDPKPAARRPRPESPRDDEDLFAAPARRPRPTRDEEPGRPPRRPSREDRARTPREDPPRGARPTRDERKPARPTADKPPREDRPRRPARDEAAGRPRPAREDPRARGTRDPNRARDTGKPREGQPDRKPPRPDPNRQPPRRPRPTER